MEGLYRNLAPNLITLSANLKDGVRRMCDRPGNRKHFNKHAPPHFPAARLLPSSTAGMHNTSLICATNMAVTDVSVADVRAAQAKSRARSEALRSDLVARLKEAAGTLATAKKQLSAQESAAQVVCDEAQVLAQRLSLTAQTAERVSARIQALDEEQRRLTLATDRARQTAELKASLVALDDAIDRGDWDAAVLHVQKAMAIPEVVLHSKFAASVVPTATLPDPPPATLTALRQRLQHIFERAYRSATASKDSASATRFFKLFPQVGLRNEGLAVYAESACELVRDMAVALNDGLAATAASGAAFGFSTLLTRLFEHMALLVDRHETLVNKYYGAGSFGQGVMPHLQAECDRLGSRIVDIWLETRGASRLLEQSDARSFPSRLQASRGRVPSPAPNARSTTPMQESDDDFDNNLRREVDQLLAEAAAVSTAWATYKGFLYDRLGIERATDSESAEPMHGSGPKIVRDSKLGQQIRTFLRGPYLQLEGAYLCRSLANAWNVAVLDLQSRPLASSFVDDSFYIVRAALSRALSTSDVPTARAACNHAAEMLQDEVLSRIRSRLDSTARSSLPMMNVEGPRKETATREMRTTFVIWLNGLHNAVLYNERMRHDLSEAEFLAQFYDSDVNPDPDETAPCDPVPDMPTTQMDILRHELQKALEEPHAQFRATLSAELERLFNVLTRSKIRTLLTNAYKDVSYVLDDASYAIAEEKDAVLRQFSAAWDRMWAVFKDTLEPANFDTYHGLAIDALVRPWEKLVLSMRFTALGALRFDHDLRAISAHVTRSATGRTKGMAAREQFIRLQQMSYLLSLDPDEDEESAYETAAMSGMSWRLSNSEAKHIRSLRLS